MSKVEIREDQREALERLAQQRGECDVSHLVQEALDQFLGDEDSEEARRAKARRLWGSISNEAADHMLETVHELRESWR